MEIYDWQIAAMNKTFNLQIQVKRSIFADDGAGGSSVTTELLGPYPARLKKTSKTADVLIGGVPTAKTIWACSTIHNLDIRSGDLLSVVGGDRTFHVIGTSAESSNMVALRVDCYSVETAL